MSCPPIGGISLAAAAREMNVSLRMVERAARVLRAGVPELIASVERGELRLGAAEIIARTAPDLQAEIIAKGAPYARRLASLLRRSQ